MSSDPTFVYYPDHEDEVFSPGNSRGEGFVVFPKDAYLRNDGRVAIDDNDPVLAPLVDTYDLDPSMENTFVVPSTMTVDQMFAILSKHPAFERISPCPLCPTRQPCGY